MNVTRYLTASLVVAVFIIFWGWFYHLVILHAVFGALDYTWMRPIAQVQSMSTWVFLALILFSLFFVFFFTRYRKEGGAKHGLTYGFWIGALFSATMFTWYVMVPISLAMAISWIIGGLIELTIAGFLTGLIYRK